MFSLYISGWGNQLLHTHLRHSVWSEYRAGVCDESHRAADLTKSRQNIAQSDAAQCRPVSHEVRHDIVYTLPKSNEAETINVVFKYEIACICFIVELCC